MTRLFRSALLATLIAPLAHTALAHEYELGELEIGHPWASAPPPGAPSVAGYLGQLERTEKIGR